MSPIHCGRGYNIPYVDFMNLIDTCFGFNTPETRFIGHLPKCYREEYRPQDQNYVVTEDGVLTAAVGAYDHEIVVCGRHIPCRGIGNVGVHPDHRSKGYMTLAMNKALEDMIADGIVLSTLSGRRQRYQHFGYEKAGPCYTFHISPDNYRHIFGKGEAPFAMHSIKDPNDPAIDEILRFTASQPFNPVRPRNRYLAIANSWKADLFTFTDPAEGNRFVGYCIMDRHRVLSEVHAECHEELLGLLHSFYVHSGGNFGLQVPAYDVNAISLLSSLAEGHSLGTAMMYNILNYAVAVDAFMALKLTYTTLPDGELIVRIHGYARDETIRVTVKDGQHAVESLPADASVDLELTHLQAIELLFSPVSGLRETQSPLVRVWFPLPIWMYHADEV